MTDDATPDGSHVRLGGRLRSDGRGRANVFRRPNGSVTQLRGQGPRAGVACGMLVAAYTAGQRHAICNQHDAATLVFGLGASAPGQVRAASAAVTSWAASYAPLGESKYAFNS